MGFIRQHAGFHINLFLSLEANLLQTFNFVFYRLLKNITKFCVVVLGLRPMTFGVITCFDPVPKLATYCHLLKKGGKIANNCLQP